MTSPAAVLPCLLLLALAGTPAAAEIYPRVPPDQASYGGPFELVDGRGRTVTERDFLGRHVLLYFGYTDCPDVCPTTLYAMAEALKAMGADGERVTPVFVNLDVEQAAPERLDAYATWFHPRMVALTGDAAQVRRAADAFRVRYFYSEANGQRVMTHLGFTFFIGPDGRIVTWFPHGADAGSLRDTMLHFLREDAGS